MIGRRTTAAWAPAIVAVFALLFASNPVLAWEPHSSPAMTMAMTSADESGSDEPCNPVKITCARLCIVPCHGLVPTPAAVITVMFPASLHHRLAVNPLLGTDPESEDPPPRS